MVPRSATNLITFKYRDFETQQYPLEKAVNWILNTTGKYERTVLLIPPGNIDFYVNRIRADKDKIDPKRFIYYPLGMANELIYPINNLKEYCYAEKVSYVVFPFGPNNSPLDLGGSKEAKYLKESRDDVFTEVAKFNIEDNYILIYKVNEIPDVLEE
jgi:hypothetical protein